MKYGVIIIIILFLGSTLAIGLQTLGQTEPTIIKDKEEIIVKDYTFYFDDVENTYSIFAKIENNQIIYNIPLTEATTRFAFREDPRTIGEIHLDEDVTDKLLAGNKIYLTYNPNENNVSKIVVAGIEVARILGNVFGLNIIEAYTEDANPINEDVPLRDCSDASNTTTVIQLEVSDKTEIISEGNCIILKGTTPDELIRSADKLGMNLIGIEL